MADLKWDYEAKDADCHLTAGGSEAILMFLTEEGWGGVTLGRADLVRFQDRISRELSRQVPPAQPR